MSGRFKRSYLALDEEPVVVLGTVDVRQSVAGRVIFDKVRSALVDTYQQRYLSR